MTVPPSTPAGFTARAGLIVDCPLCGEVSRDLGHGKYRCLGDEEHDFRAGVCQVCGSAEVLYRKKPLCTNPDCSSRR